MVASSTFPPLHPCAKPHTTTAVPGYRLRLEREVAQEPGGRWREGLAGAPVSPEDPGMAQEMESKAHDSGIMHAQMVSTSL